MSDQAIKVRTILIGALGGEGGGVLMDWIVHCARMSGLAVQATSVPGVAQRTGSTSYYIEMCDKPASGPQPVFALTPMPGRVDYVAASEFVEAARMMERGLVSPTRTVLIASTSRMFTTVEKMQMGDGRFESERVAAAGRDLAKTFVMLDLDAIARAAGTMVSATLFGALAGVGAFPWDRATCEAAIGSGRAAGASRAGFNAAFEAARGPAPTQTQSAPENTIDMRRADKFSGLPTEARNLAALGHARCADYQDGAYADLYARRMLDLAPADDAEQPERAHALAEAARRLALWMTYEDIARVAQLKTKRERFAKIRAEAEMDDDQILAVTEFLKPGADEIAAVLPARVGAAFLRRVARKGPPGFIGQGLQVTTTSVRGFLTMRLLAQFRRIRRSSLRFGYEQAAIDRWLAAMQAALAASPAFAAALAELPRLLKGYGETQARGQRNYDAIFDRIVASAIAAGDFSGAKQLRAAISAALADPEHAALDAELRASAQ